MSLYYTSNVIIPDFLETKIEGFLFTSREVDVLSCIFSGRSVKSIGLLLSLSPKTIETYIRNILQKSHCHSREELIKKIEVTSNYGFLKNHYLYLISVNRKNEILEKLKSHFAGYHVKIITEKKGLEALIKKAKEDFRRLGFAIEFTSLEGHPVETHSRKEKTLLLHIISSKPGDSKEKAGNPYGICRLTNLNEDGQKLDLQSLEEVNRKGSGLSWDSFILKALREVINKDNVVSIIQPFFNNHKDSQYVLRKIPIHKKLALSSQTFGRKGILIAILLFLSSLGGRYWMVFQKEEKVSNLYYLVKSRLLPRHLDIKKLDQIFKIHKDQDQNPIVAIVGIGGSGKTTLARMYSSGLKYPLSWEINARSKESLLESFENLASVLGDISDINQKDYKKIPIGGSRIERQTRLLLFLKRALNRQKNWVLIYDNLNENLADIQEFLFVNKDICGNGKIIITTRDSSIRASIDYGNVVELSHLKLDEKLELFLRIQSFKETRNFSKKELENLLKRIPSFPLDIAIAAHCFSLNTVNNKENTVRKAERDLLSSQHALKHITSHKISRGEIIKNAGKDIIRISPEFKEMLFYLTLIGSENIPRKLFDNIYGRDTVNDFIYHLERHSFITSKNLIGLHEVFSIHDSIQKVIFEYFNTLLSRSKIKIISKKLESLLIDYIENLGVISLHMNDVKMVKLFIYHASEYLKNNTFSQSSQQAYLLGTIGWNNALIGRFQEAENLLKIALTKIYPKEKSYKTSKLRWTLGYTLLFLGKFEESLRNLKTSMINFESLNSDPSKEYGFCLIHIGGAYLYMGEYKKALDYINKGYVLGKRIKNLEVTNFAKVWRGYCLNEMEKYNEAFEFLQEGAAFYKSHNLNHHYQWARMHLGINLLSQGNHKEAIYLLEEAKKSYKNRLGSTYVNVGVCEKNLSLSYALTSQFSKSQKSINKAYEIYKNHYGQNNTETATVLAYMGIVQFLEGNLEAAKSLFLKSQKVYVTSKRIKAKIPGRYLKKIEALEKTSHP